MTAPLPPDEARRLETLRQYQVLDTGPEMAFDDLTLLAAQICRTSIALVSLVDENRQWFKSKVGMDAAETSRDIAFCAHTILHRDEVLEVRDAEADPRFADSLLVTSEPHIRFYAGAPLVAPDGHALGALCVMDRAPHALDADQLSALRALSRQVVAQLELKKQARALANEVAERLCAEERLREHVSQLSAGKVEADRLLALAQKSRKALLSVLEDERRAGQSLRDSEERFRQLAENINEVFWITDPTMHELHYVSPAYEKIWGRTCASLYATPREWLEAIHEEDRPRIIQAAADILKTGTFDVEYRVIRPEGAIRWIHDRGFPVRNAAGEIYRVAGTAEDITGRKKLEDEYRQSQKLESIGQLAGGVAHDFNNILMVIQMEAELLLCGGGLSTSQRECAEDIGSTVQRAAALTRQLLLFSRREVFQPRDLDLGESIANTVKMLRRILGENIQMQLKLSCQPLFLHADPGMMDQILLNLVVNARDAMPKGGQLVIETSGVVLDELAAEASARGRPGSFACLMVSDTGTGIPPEILPKIFDPFFTTKDVGKGTGLGLATVFGIVQQHEGWIDVMTKVGLGTAFRIYLPLLAREHSAGVAPARTTVRGGTEAILLVEDDPALRVSLRKGLAQLGYRIIEAPTGVKALEVWKENRDQIRLLLTDLVMPDRMTGKELAETMLRDNPKLKVIYMSGYSAEIIGKDLPLKEGVNFLTKPFPAAKMAEAVRNSLDIAPAG